MLSIKNWISISLLLTPRTVNKLVLSISLLLVLFIVSLCTTISEVLGSPSIKYYCMCKVLHVCNAQTLIVTDLYTNQIETVVIAGTQLSNNNYVNMQAVHFIENWCLKDDYMCLISYGHDCYHRTIGDIKHCDRIQCLSYTLISAGYVYWYPNFYPGDTLAQGCSHWARQHHNGVYRNVKSNT